MPEQPSLFPVDLDERMRLQQIYDGLAERFGLHPARVRISRRKLTGGHITYGPPHSIVISAHLSEKDKIATLKHEAAHAYCFRSHGPDEAHSPKFWKVARAFGAHRRHAPETVALNEFRKKREIVYRCESCRAYFRRIRPFRRAMLCAACHRKGKSARLRRVRTRPSAEKPK
ncbi:MAG TPA: SprT-like domain-containing protein [Thermoanaerobaculia bacterium]|jgi:predicted SprT family Zn-dependent metalloprotease|nr:SprT-like domain-containing protein [Thermoanaerobaculia bacterium]